MSGREIPVGREDIDMSWLRRVYGEENVRKASRIWSCIITKVTTQPIQEQILASESPQGAWRVFQDFYTRDGSQERDILDDTWNCMSQKEGETLMEYWGRASAVWMKLKTLGDNREDSSMTKHFARGLLPKHSSLTDRILYHSTPTRQITQGLLRQAELELGNSRRRREGYEATTHALVAAAPGANRGGSTRTAAAAGASGGPSSGLQQREAGGQLFCHYHGWNMSHSTTDCLRLRQDLANNINEFMQFMQHRGTGATPATPAQGFGGPQWPMRFQDGPYRQPPYQNDTGPGWNRGPSPQHSGPPQRRQGAGPAAVGSRNSGGRGYGGYGSPPSMARGPPAGGGSGGNFPPSNFPNLPAGHFQNVQRQPVSAHVARSDNAAGYYEPAYGSAERGPWPGPVGSNYHEGFSGAGDAAAEGQWYGHNTDGERYQQTNVNPPRGESSPSPAGPDAQRPWYMPQLFDASTPLQHHLEQQQQPSDMAAATSAAPAPISSPSPPGTSSAGAPQSLFIARRVNILGESRSVSESDESERVSESESVCAGRGESVCVWEGSKRGESEKPREDMPGVIFPRLPDGAVLVAHVTRRVVSNALLCHPKMPRPKGSEQWQADSGASAMISNKSDQMYNVRTLDSDQQFIQIGDTGLIRVAAIGSLDLRFHQIGPDGRVEDYDVTIPEILFVPGCGFNLFSLWRVSHKHEVRINPRGTQLMEGKLRFIRGMTSDSLFATRLQPRDALPAVNMASESALVSTAFETDRASTLLYIQKQSELKIGFDGSELSAFISDPEFEPPRITEAAAEHSSRIFDISESVKSDSALAVLGPARLPFNVGNARRSIDINVLHDRAGHLSEPILRLTAKAHGMSVTGVMDPCRFCLPARGTKAAVSKTDGGYRGQKAPNDMFHIDICGPYSATIGGNHYLLFGVDAATGWMVCNAMRRKSEGVVMFKRMVVDAAFKAGTAIKSIRCDCDAVWTSAEFKDFCATMGIAITYSPPGAQQYNGVAESAIQRCLKIAKASRRSAQEKLGPGGFSRVPGLDERGDKLWAESAKDATQKLNQAVSPSNPGGGSPQELYTGKKLPFRLVPFFQYGFMSERPRTKMDDRAVPCFFLNAGDNHADVCVKVIKASTGSVCYTSNIAWAELPPQSGGGGAAMHRTPPRPYRPRASRHLSGPSPTPPLHQQLPQLADRDRRLPPTPPCCGIRGGRWHPPLRHLLLDSKFPRL